ncbi:hypothetical protein M0804_006711 [Polistes exclamans]|nr:hypothetical protein M0804_006711 [Polistes exclamans]
MHLGVGGVNVHAFCISGQCGIDGTFRRFTLEEGEEEEEEEEEVKVKEEKEEEEEERRGRKKGLAAPLVEKKSTGRRSGLVSLNHRLLLVRNKEIKADSYTGAQHDAYLLYNEY